MSAIGVWSLEAAFSSTLLGIVVGKDVPAWGVCGSDSEREVETAPLKEDKATDMSAPG